MKKVLTIITVFFIVLILGSCKRCYQCVIRDANDNDEIWTTYKEICGSNGDIDAYKGICEDGVITTSALPSVDTMNLDLYCDCGDDLDL